MKQSEFIRELRINLETKLLPAELEDIISDYESFFAAGRGEGKSDDEISEELGSPAYLAKSLLDEHSVKDSSKGLKEVVKQSANPGRRLSAYLIDAVIAILPAFLISLVLLANVFLPCIMFVTSPSPLAGAPVYLSYASYTTLSDATVITESNNGVDSTYVYKKGLDGEWKLTEPDNSVQVFAVLSLVFYFLYSTICTLLLKGQTLGKKIMKIKVQRTNTERASGGAIFIREFLGKVLINSIPIVPLISLFTILLTKDNKALHDMLADTIVTEIGR